MSYCILYILFALFRYSEYFALIQTFWTLAAMIVQNMKFSEFIHFCSIEIHFKQAIEHWNLLYNSWVTAIFLKSFLLVVAILNFGGHIGKNTIFLTLILPQSKCFLNKILSNKNLFHNSWVITTFLKNFLTFTVILNFVCQIGLKDYNPFERNPY